MDAAVRRFGSGADMTLSVQAASSWIGQTGAAGAVPEIAQRLSGIL